MRDIAEVFDELGIPYRERGSNVSSGNVVVKCPWCPDDPSMHLHVSRENGAYYCWRDDSHRGRSPIRLVMKLANVSRAEALSLLGLSQWKLPEETKEAVRKHRDSVEGITLPETFFPLWKSDPRCIAYLNFLRKRGFDDPVRCAKMFGLHACNDGYWAGGVILPITIYGVVKCWQVRFIAGDLRYASLSATKEIEGCRAAAPTSELVGLFDQALHGGEVLVVVEGAFDAMKLTYYGRDEGLSSVCLFGCSGISAEQEMLLSALRQKYERFVIMFDVGALHKADRVASFIRFLKPEVIPLETVTKASDPGDMSKEEIVAFARSFL